MFLAALLLYEAVAVHSGQCEKLLRHVKLAPSAMLAFACSVIRES
jgi:hypothetical protein